MADSHGNGRAAALVAATALLLCSTASMALTPDGRYRSHFAPNLLNRQN
jgi:hypothetical protein